jgi:hypothetical protein
MTDYNGNVIMSPEAFTAKDLAIRALGFNSQLAAETQYGRGVFNRRKGRLTKRKAALTTKWKNTEPKERMKLWSDEIAKYNAALSPEERLQHRITLGSLLKSLQARKTRERQTTYGAFSTFKERGAKERLKFLNVPRK